MDALELFRSCQSDADRRSLYIGAFADEFRRADPKTRRKMVERGPTEPGMIEGLVAAVVSALCREAGMIAPGWVDDVYSPEPFFVFPAEGYELRVRLMLESPPPFKVRNVFVPESFLSRA